MPKRRYAVMRNYMPKKGRLGLDMMLRTCTVQVNLDYADEADMVKKFRVGLALQPVAVALFANSPFVEEKPVGYLSYRSHVWTDVDPDRCGTLPFVFEPGFGFERYVDYMLDVPMYFVYRDGRYIDAAGQSFRDFMAGKLPALPGATPTMSDWSDHLTTAFPEVRLKRILEMRGADAGPWAQICALPALWSGLLYDAQSLDGAAALIADWTEAERQAPAPRYAAPRPRGAVPRPHRARARARRPGARAGGPRAPRPARQHRPGRKPFSRHPYGCRPFRPHPGRTAARTVRGSVAPQRRPDLQRRGLLSGALSGAEVFSGNRIEAAAFTECSPAMGCLSPRPASTPPRCGAFFFCGYRSPLTSRSSAQPATRPAWPRGAVPTATSSARGPRTTPTVRGGTGRSPAARRHPAPTKE